VAEYSNEKRGVLFRNNKDGNESRPDYKGNCEINGEKYNISAWIKESKKDGSKFMSLSFDPKEGGSPTRSVSPAVEEDVPF
jgi:hypothetical protein